MVPDVNVGKILVLTGKSFKVFPAYSFEEAFATERNMKKLCLYLTFVF